MKIVVLLLFFILYSCVEKENDLFRANREAPLGGVSIKIDESYNFVYTIYSLSERELYNGRIEYSNDTLYFHFEQRVDFPKKGYVKKDKLQFYDSNEYFLIQKNNAFSQTNATIL